MITKEIREQMEKVRLSGRTNMCEWRTVQRLAFDMDLYELVAWIEDSPKRYFHFIVFGRED